MLALRRDRDVAGREEPEATDLGPEARLGISLRRARERRGISLRALARRLYRAHSTLVEYERGHRLAPIEVVKSYEAELGIAATTVFLPVPGVELVGPFPPGFQHFFVLTAGVGAAAKQPDAAKALIKHIAAPSAAAVLKAKGLEPVTR